MKDPKENLAGLTRTASDVGGPDVETFGMISDHGSRSEVLLWGTKLWQAWEAQTPLRKDRAGD